MSTVLCWAGAAVLWVAIMTRLWAWRCWRCRRRYFWRESCDHCGWETVEKAKRWVP